MIIAFGAEFSPGISQVSTLMKPIYRGFQRVDRAMLQCRSQFIGQGCFAGAVYSIDSDEERAIAFFDDDSIGYLSYEPIFMVLQF